MGRHSFITYFKKPMAVILLALVFLEAGLRIEGRIGSILQEFRNRRAAAQKNAYRILCLGESMTQNQYPRFLEEALNQRGIGVRFSVIDKGQTGSNSQTIIRNVVRYLDEYRPDMVTAMMGVNDRNEFKSLRMPDRKAPFSKMERFIESLRIFKLAQLLRLDIASRFKKVSLTGNRLRLNQETGSESDLETYLVLGEAYGSEGRFEEAEAVLQKTVGSDLTAQRGFIALGYLYQLWGRFGEAEASMKKALEINPISGQAYIGLGHVYYFQRRFEESEAAYKRALEINPSSLVAHMELGLLFYDLRRYQEALQSLEAAVRLDPSHSIAQVYLARIYAVLGRYRDAETLLLKAIGTDPGNGDAYLELGELYVGQNRFLEADSHCRKTVARFKDAFIRDRAYLQLARLYENNGREQEARYFYDKAVGLRMDRSQSFLYRTYPLLKEMLDARGIPLVCVQYPMCRLQPLRNIFDDAADIVFVDNEAVFRNAVKREGYDAYFTDRSGGEFGHCTEKGNRLLAQNIADTILKEVFSK